MAGLLSDVLPYIYSRGNALKRQLGGLLSDPVGSAQQSLGLLADQVRENDRLSGQAFSNPQRPFQVTDQNALNSLVERTLAGPISFSPTGMLGAGPADQIAEILGALKRVPAKDRAGLRMLPSDVPTPNIGDPLRPSTKWVDGVQTEKMLNGTSAMDLGRRTPAEIAQAIHRLGLYHRFSYYPGNKLAIISGPSKRKGEDAGEAVIRDAVTRFLTDPPLGAR